MNWKLMAEEDLKKYTAQKQSIESIPQKIIALKDRAASIKCGISDMDPVQGGVSQTEDKLLDNMMERERLKYTYKASKRMVELIEKGLSGLDDEEKLVLDRFYINRSQGHVERLMEELNFEQRQVYNIKDKALYKFTIAMYGMVEY